MEREGVAGELGSALAITRQEPAPPPDATLRWRWTVPAGWEQGRGAYGGLVLGAMVKAMLASEDDPLRQARSVSGTLSAPVEPGPAEIAVRAVRRGNAVTTWGAVLTQGGEVRAEASLLVGRDRPIDQTIASRPEPVVPWEALRPVSIGPPLAPAFTRFFEFRVPGRMPFSGGDEAVAASWIKPRISPPAFDAPTLVALADVCWPASFMVQRAPRPTATAAFTLAFTWPDTPLDPTEPLLHRGRVLAGGHGYFVELRELWTVSGELVVVNPQTFVWIK